MGIIFYFLFCFFFMSFRCLFSDVVCPFAFGDYSIIGAVSVSLFFCFSSLSLVPLARSY